MFSFFLLYGQIPTFLPRANEVRYVWGMGMSRGPGTPEGGVDIPEHEGVPGNR